MDPLELMREALEEAHKAADLNEVPVGAVIAKDGVIVGMAVETFSDQGFGGRIRLMVGLLPDGRIKDIEVIEHKETPGLGDKMDKTKLFINRIWVSGGPSQKRMSPGAKGRVDPILKRYSHIYVSLGERETK